MAGVILNDKRKRPLYKNKPLERVDEDVKALLVKFQAFNVLSFLLVIAFFSRILRKYSEDDFQFWWFLCFTSQALVVSFVFIYHVYEDCCKTQYVKCGFSNELGRKRTRGITMIGTLLVIASILPEVAITYKITSTLYCVGTIVFLLGFFKYSKRFCQCKECLELKDVKISYGNGTIRVAEWSGLNSAFLQRALNIPTTQKSRIALQIENGDIIHEYTGDEFVQLHEGEYVVREFIHYLKPIVDEAEQQTATFSEEQLEKNDEDATKDTEMTDDEWVDTVIINI